MRVTSGWRRSAFDRLRKLRVVSDEVHDGRARYVQPLARRSAPCARHLTPHRHRPCRDEANGVARRARSYSG